MPRANAVGGLLDLQPTGATKAPQRVAMRKSIQGRATWPWMLVGVSLLSACTVLDPQFVSKPLMTSRYEVKPCAPSPSGGEATAESTSSTCPPLVGDTAYYGELPRAIDQVNQLRYDYMSAVRAETAWPNVIGAAMLPLTAMTIYKGVTSSGESTQRWLTKAGLLAGSGYIFGTTFVSKPRARIYLAGADALGCAVLSSRPMLYPKDHAQALRAGIAQLESDIAQIDIAMSKAQGALDEMKADSARSLEVCNQPGPAAVPPLADPADRERLKSRSPAWAQYQACQLRRGAQVSAATTVKAIWLKLSSRQKALLKRRNNLVTLATDGHALLGRLDMAGTVLREKAISIQNQVAAEVLKTEPDLGAIMQSVGGLKSFAYSFSGAAPLAPPAPASAAAAASAPAAEARDAASAKMVEEQRKATGLDDVEQAITKGEADAAVVYRYLQEASAVSRSVADLSACKFTAPGNQLAVQPDVEEVMVRAGGKAAFVVSGGVGTPQAHLVGVGTDKAKLEPIVVSGAAHVVTVSVTNAIDSGEVLKLLLTDSSGQAPRVVQIRSPAPAVVDTAAEEGASPAPALPAKPAGAQAVSAAQAAVCKKLGQTSPCADKEPVKRCMKAVDSKAKDLSDELANKMSQAVDNGEPDCQPVVATP